MYYHTLEVFVLRNADAKKNPENSPYHLDIRLSFDQRIQDEVLCDLVEDMRLAIQTNYPIMNLQILGDDVICASKNVSHEKEHRTQVVPS